MVNKADKFVDLANVEIDIGEEEVLNQTPTKLVKPAGEWWVYFRLLVECKTDDATVEEAYIGAGGA